MAPPKKPQGPTVILHGDVHGPQSGVTNEHVAAAVKALAEALTANAKAVEAVAAALKGGDLSHATGMRIGS
jgi:hypothetical protein